MATILSVIFWLKIHSLGKNRHPISLGSEVSNADISKISHEVCILLPLYSPYTEARKKLTRPVRIVAFHWWKKDSRYPQSASDVDMQVLSSEKTKQQHTAQETYLGVKEQAVACSIADMGMCETWPAFPCNVSTPSLSKGKRKSSKDNRNVRLLRRSTS